MIFSTDLAQSFCQSETTKITKRPNTCHRPFANVLCPKAFREISWRLIGGGRPRESAEFHGQFQINRLESVLRGGPSSLVCYSDVEKQGWDESKVVGTGFTTSRPR